MISFWKHAAKAFALVVFLLAPAALLLSCANDSGYSSPEDWPQFSFERPQGWRLVQFGPNPGDARRFVSFSGPANSANTLRSHMFVSFFKPTDPEAPYKTPEELVKVVVTGPLTERVRKTETITIDGRTASEIIFDGFYPPPHPIRDVDRVPNTGWIVLIEEGGNIFQLDYGAAREDFEKYAPLFEKMLESFRFER